MNKLPEISALEHKIFNTSYYDFEQTALDIFRIQYAQNTVYKAFVDLIRKDISEINSLESIPFLPISFFKTHKVVTGSFEPDLLFESSGTTGMDVSRHFIKKEALYRQSFTQAFRTYFGDPRGYCILGLLPGYLERKHSSLVHMVQELIELSNNLQSGFYLDNHDKLYKVLAHNEIVEQPTLLIGVTFALMDFAEQYSMKLSNTHIMETGGMKGRRKELTRQEVHNFLKERLGVDKVASEYGMAELLSQAYALSHGRFQAPPWMKVLIRDAHDPFSTKLASQKGGTASGLINVIDLANLYSCSFIATEDLGKLYKDGSFEVLGRSDTSEIRGCSLLVV